MSKRKPALAGKQIRTLKELDAARRERRAVISAGVPCFSMPKPAAVVIMLQGETILRTFQRGLYYYEKPNRKKKGPMFHKSRKKKITPIEALNHLLNENGMSASDLGRLLGNTALGSAILRGERGLSKAHISKLSKRFKVSADLFLE